MSATEHAVLFTSWDSLRLKWITHKSKHCDHFQLNVVNGVSCLQQILITLCLFSWRHYLCQCSMVSINFECFCACWKYNLRYWDTSLKWNLAFQALFKSQNWQYSYLVKKTNCTATLLLRSVKSSTARFGEYCNVVLSLSFYSLKKVMDTAIKQRRKPNTLKYTALMRNRCLCRPVSATRALL